jgi:acyl phosphate:glycerol-3-phosphate acyltransferase
MMQAIFLIGGFLLGAIPFGYLVAKAKGIDITQTGSGNIGATNVLRVLGKGPGLAVFGLDVLKGFVPAFLAKYYLDSIEWSFFAGLCAILGHSFSPFLKFKGGKGIATGLGALLGSVPAVGMSAFAVFFFFMTGFGFVSLASIFAALSMPVWGFVYQKPITVIVALALLAVYIASRHKANIDRIRNGTEPVLGQKTGEPKPSLTKVRVYCIVFMLLLAGGSYWIEFARQP